MGPMGEHRGSLGSWGLVAGPISSILLLVGYHGELKVNLFHNTRSI